MTLSREPFCRYCAEMGEPSPATVADHVVPVRERPDLAFDESNLCGLCAHCHSRVKQKEEATGVMVGCTADGEPRGGWSA